MVLWSVSSSFGLLDQEYIPWETRAFTYEEKKRFGGKHEAGTGLRTDRLRSRDRLGRDDRFYSRAREESGARSSEWNNSSGRSQERKGR